MADLRPFSRMEEDHVRALQEDPSVLAVFPHRPDSTILVVKRLLFHYTLAVQVVGEPFLYDDRYCYQTQTGAEDAAKAWSLQPELSEPIGWHRHPATGRRRPDLTAASEYIAP